MSETTRYRRRGRTYEHRVVARTLIGRELLPCEVVHHENEVKTDNQPENLVIFSRGGDHSHFHAQLRGQPLRRYMPAIPLGAGHPAFTRARPSIHGRLAPVALLDAADLGPLWEWRRSLPAADRARFDRLRPLLLAA